MTCGLDPGLPLAVLWDPFGYLGPPFGSLWGALGLPLAVLWGPCGHCGAQGAGPWAIEENLRKPLVFEGYSIRRILRGSSADLRGCSADLRGWRREGRLGPG